MKKILLTIACALALSIGAATNASANDLTIGDAFFLGSIDDGIPASADDEAGYINNLITLAAGQGDTTIGTETYNRVGSTVAGPFPTADPDDTMKVETGDNIVNLTGWAYILGKYDGPNAGSLVWFVDGALITSIPDSWMGYDLSHFSVYNSDPTTVPDGGATLGLLGLALLGLGYARRRLA